MKKTELEELIEKYDLVGKSFNKIIDILKPTDLGQINVVHILDYINQHYAIKPDVMRELKKEENVRRILEGENDLSKELYLTLYNDVVTTPIAIRVTDYENGFGFGFDGCGGFYKNGKWNWKSHPQYWRKSTPEEIQSMLVKKLEADGFGVNTRYKCVNGYESTLNTTDLIYYPERPPGGAN